MKKHKYIQFTIDMEKVGYVVENYRGRNYYDGPAVITDSDLLQPIIRATKIKLQWDTLGKDSLVIYPV